MVVLDGTLRCCLCKGFISTSNSERFSSHMNNEHNTFFNTDFLLAACKLNSVNPTDFGIVKTIMEGMYEENLKSREEEFAMSGDSSSSNSSSLGVDSTNTEMWEEEEKEVRVKRGWEEVDNSREKKEERPTLQLPDYPDIPHHLIDEFEKLCDRKESDEAGFEPSFNIPNNGGMGPCKMLKTGKDLLKRSFSVKETGKDILKRSLSMKSLKGVISSLDDNDSNDVKKKSFDCPHCEKTFHLTFLLKKHISSCHQNDKNPHPCPFCKKSFRFSLLLRRHVQFKHKENNPITGREAGFENDKSGKDNYPCEICDKTFSQLGNMKRHMKTVHSNTPVFNCGECGKTFHQSGNLKRHQATHSMKSEVDEDRKVSIGDLRVFTESLV